jgi:hypothetical protein
MAIKFNHVTNTISFTSGVCSTSFVDSSATGIFETTGYARNCYVTTGQTGNFNAFISDTVNCNLNYKYDLNTVSNSTGSAVFQGRNNVICTQLNSQINNGSCNCIIANGCFNYIENGCNNFISGSSCFSEVLNGSSHSITGGIFSTIVNGSGNLIRGGCSMAIINSITSCICGAGAFADTVVGGCCHLISSVSRSAVVGGLTNHICSSSNDSIINAGRSNTICGAVISAIIAGNTNRLCHGPGTCTQTGSIIIGGQQSTIGGCFGTNFNAIINSNNACICSGSCNAIINGSFSCIMTGALNSTIIGPRNTICGLTGAVVIGSGITANANNTLFVNNLCAIGSIIGTGNFITTSQTGCFITTGQTGAFGGGGGTTLPNGASANSALCWNGSAWTTGQSYVATGQTGNFVTRSQTGCFITTGQTGAFGGGGGSSLCSGVNTIYESFTPSNIVNTNLINFDVIPNSTLFYTGTSTSNFYLNLRGSSSCTLNSLLPLNNSISVSFLYVNGATPYALTGVNTDGTAMPIIWAGGGGNPSGAANATNVYSITAFKIGNNLFRVFGSLGFFS